MDLIATRPMVYGTRRLSAGDRFTTSNMNGRLLIAIKKAKAAPDRAEAKHKASGAPADGLAALRKEYQDVLGKRAFNGWDAETLQSKIAEAKDAN